MVTTHLSADGRPRIDRHNSETSYADRRLGGWTGADLTDRFFIRFLRFLTDFALLFC